MRTAVRACHLGCGFGGISQDDGVAQVEDCRIHVCNSILYVCNSILILISISACVLQLTYLQVTLCVTCMTGVNRENMTEKDTEQPQQTNYKIQVTLLVPILATRGHL